MSRSAACVVALLGFLLLAAGVRQAQSPTAAYIKEAVAASMQAAGYEPNVRPFTVPEPSPGPRPRPVRGGAYTVDFRKVAYRQAKAAGIKDPNLFVRQMAAESGFQPCVGSPAGAIGIAQIMPDTAKSWKVDPFMPVDALREAAKRMAVYERQLGSYEVALAAYNAGPGAVQEYGGVPPYPETREYIRRITTDYPLRGMSQTYKLPGGYTSSFRTRLGRLMKAVERNGGKITVVSGWRSYSEQVALWKDGKRKHGGWEGARKWVAPPGCSNHNRGTAADIKGDLNLAHRLAPRYGLSFPMAHEPWHVERS